MNWIYNLLCLNIYYALFHLCLIYVNNFCIIWKKVINLKKEKLKKIMYINNTLTLCDVLTFTLLNFKFSNVSVNTSHNLRVLYLCIFFLISLFWNLLLFFKCCENYLYKSSIDKIVYNMHLTIWIKYNPI